MTTDQKRRKRVLKTTLLPNSEQVQQKPEPKGTLALCENSSTDGCLKLRVAGQGLPAESPEERL